MTIVVQLPDGGTAQFPDGMDPQAIQAVLHKQFAQQSEQQARETYSPTAGIGGGQLLLEGVGGGMEDAAIGTGQTMAHTAHSPWTAGALASINPALLLAGLMQDPKAADAVAKEKAQIDAPLNATTAGRVGNVGGRIAATLPTVLAGGGVPAAGQKFVPALLNAMRTGAAQGAGSALASPTDSDNYAADKTKEVLGGAAFGGLASGGIFSLAKGLSATVGGVKTLAKKLEDFLPNATQAARERAAAQLIRSSAADASKAGASGAQFVPGVTPATAEAAGDIGLAGLQRTLQSMSPEFNTQVTQLAQANNAARVGAIKSAFGGADEASATAIEAARDAATAPLLAAAKKVKGVNVAPIDRYAESIIKSRAGNPTVQATIQSVRDALKDAGNDVAQLHNVRQFISDKITSAGTDNAAKASVRELMSLKGALDTQISKSAPQFRQFLRQYADMSKQAGQVRMGEELLSKATSVPDAMGNPMLSQAQFNRAAGDLDRVAKAATGFKKETAQRLMTPEQMAAFNAVKSDLDRAAQIGAGKSVGSDTVQKAVGATKVQEATGALGVLGWAPAKLLNPLRAHYGEKTLKLVQDAMLNPGEAARLMAAAPRGQQNVIANLLSDPRFLKAMQAAQEAAQSGGSAGAGLAGAAMAGGQQQP